MDVKAYISKRDPSGTYAKDFLAHALQFGFTEDDLYRTFKDHRGREQVIVGWWPKRKKYKVITLQLKNQKTYVWPIIQVLELIHPNN